MNFKTTIMKTITLIISTLLITGLSFSQISMGGTSTWTQVNVPTSADMYIDKIATKKARKRLRVKNRGANL